MDQTPVEGVPEPGQEPSPEAHTSEHCFAFDWPAQYLWMTHLSRRKAPTGPPVWGGSLIQNKRDLTGQLYMRNRYYDPQSGRFTQEDPTGLAGGLNVYGFADGDPASYADPYGLCPYRSKNPKERNTDTHDCPEDKVGKGVRTLDKYGGARGDKAIGRMARAELTPILTSYAKMQSVCSELANSCITPTGKIMLASPNAAIMAAQLMHEIGHDIIPDRESWARSYLHEEPIVSEWALQVWGKIPSSMHPPRGGYSDEHREYRRNRAHWWQGRVRAACSVVQAGGDTC